MSRGQPGEADSMTTPIDEIPSRFTRRRLIQAGVVTGGALWAAPAIESFTSPAAASSKPRSCDLGVDWCYVAYRNQGDAEGVYHYTGFMGRTNTDCGCLASNDYPSTTVQNQPWGNFQLCSGDKPALKYWRQDGSRYDPQYVDSPDDGGCSFTLESDTTTCKIKAGSDKEILGAFYPSSNTCLGIPPFGSGTGNHVEVPCQRT